LQLFKLVEVFGIVSFLKRLVLEDNLLQISQLFPALLLTQIHIIPFQLLPLGKLLEYFVEDVLFELPLMHQLFYGEARHELVGDQVANIPPLTWGILSVLLDSSI